MVVKGTYNEERKIKRKEKDCLKVKYFKVCLRIIGWNVLIKGIIISLIMIMNGEMNVGNCEVWGFFLFVI